MAVTGMCHHHVISHGSWLAAGGPLREAEGRTATCLFLLWK